MVPKAEDPKTHPYLYISANTTMCTHIMNGDADQFTVSAQQAANQCPALLNDPSGQRAPGQKISLEQLFSEDIYCCVRCGVLGSVAELKAPRHTSNCKNAATGDERPTCMCIKLNKELRLCELYCLQCDDFQFSPTFDRLIGKNRFVTVMNDQLQPHCADPQAFAARNIYIYIYNYIGMGGPWVFQFVLEFEKEKEEYSRKIEESRNTFVYI